jgi:hypothetical protein
MAPMVPGKKIHDANAHSFYRSDRQLLYARASDSSDSATTRSTSG